jgi:hypothetical protein
MGNVLAMQFSRPVERSGIGTDGMTGWLLHQPKVIETVFIPLSVSLISSPS